MKNSNFMQQAKRFFKNDIYTLIVAMSIVVLAAGVPIAALTSEDFSYSSSSQNSFSTLPGFAETASNTACTAE